MLRTGWTASTGTAGRLEPELPDEITGIRSYMIREQVR